MHRELDPRRISDVRIRPGDIDRTGFQRLAQRIEHGALEFGQLIQEQHAKMRQAHLARPHPQPAAGQRRHRGRVMGRAKRPRPADPSFLQQARDRSNHRHLQRLGRSQRRQDPGQAGRHQAFSRAGRTDHQQIVAARRSNLERALGDFLALHLPEVRAMGRCQYLAGDRIRQARRAF